MLHQRLRPGFALFLLGALLLALAVSCSGSEEEPSDAGEPADALPEGAAGAAATVSPEPGDGTTVLWQGQHWNVSGVNVPWFNWEADFGGGVSNGGVSNPDVRAALEERFARLQDAGVHFVRWWMFEGTAWQVQRDESGRPTGIAEGVFDDLDAALELAEQYDLYYNLVLFDVTSGGPQFPLTWLTDAEHREALVVALGQLFERYGDHPRIFAWEVFNEPEWAIWNNAIPRDETVATGTAITQAINEQTIAYSTVGSAMLDGLSLWTESGLTLYQAHWYDDMSSGDWCAICTTRDEVGERLGGLSEPLVIGEFYAGGSVDSLERLREFHERGYAGAWAWSLFPERTYDRLAIDLEAYASFLAELDP